MCSSTLFRISSKQDPGMLNEQQKRERRKIQNRTSQREFRKRKKQQAEKEEKRNAEPVITPCGIMGASKQRYRKYSNEGLDTTISSPIEINPAPISSPNFTAFSFQHHSSQKEKRSQQIRSQDQPTTPTPVVNSQLNHGIQGFLPTPAAIASTDGSPDSWPSEPSFGNPSMRSSGSFNPYGIDAPQIGSSNGFQSAALVSTPPVRPQSKDQCSRVLSQMIGRRRQVTQAEYLKNINKIELDVEESKFRVEAERLKLRTASL